MPITYPFMAAGYTRALVLSFPAAATKITLALFAYDTACDRACDWYDRSKLMFTTFALCCTA